MNDNVRTQDRTVFGTELGPPAVPKELLQPKRYQAYLVGTPYAYDFSEEALSSWPKSTSSGRKAIKCAKSAQDKLAKVEGFSATNMLLDLIDEAAQPVKQKQEQKPKQKQKQKGALCARWARCSGGGTTRRLGTRRSRGTYRSGTRQPEVALHTNVT
ncbi:hypothetical protein TRAPUB_3680 [Trametes pubescens]|uniref:Uncharacterized protein n=1 Tax=Trametes pubescens TaxID=154538 RepID=A0A1M2VD28_TRAPU|nr:hypothetical protein TRAPUB_3680 [Trametes pubescens]